MSEKRTNTKETTQEKQRARQHRARGQERPVGQYEEQELQALQRAVTNPAVATPADILALQRTVGNRVVQRLLAQRQGGDEGYDLDDETAGRINRARGGGQPLDNAVQEEMSARQGYDFSEVRVHTDGEADDLNQQIQAKAFTTGQDIFFRQGEYDPGSGSGQELIAHELTHVVQQGTGRVSGGGGGMTVRPASDAFEQEADALSHQEYTSQRVVVQARRDLTEGDPKITEKEMVVQRHKCPKCGNEMESLCPACSGEEEEEATAAKEYFSQLGREQERQVGFAF